MIGDGGGVIYSYLCDEDQIEWIPAAVGAVHRLRDRERRALDILGSPIGRQVDRHSQQNQNRPPSHLRKRELRRPDDAGTDGLARCKGLLQGAKPRPVPTVIAGQVNI